MNERRKSETFSLILAALFAAVIAVCAQIQIPTPFFTITLQTFAVALCGYTLGAKYYPEQPPGCRGVCQRHLAENVERHPAQTAARIGGFPLPHHQKSGHQPLSCPQVAGYGGGSP